ncbi:hypothetical protein CKA38_04540 [Ereboglobus luteus]|uniref:Uncharacterized protein n=1 Tax=Ereboglobus luteus TaxID=1796921 RepID=A0A2U8E1C8_9BACT|nr:hypothetical protein CKA38_04540 [Ereboglobus luteus]
MRFALELEVLNASQNSVVPCATPRAFPLFKIVSALTTFPGGHTTSASACFCLLQTRPKSAL